MGENVYTVGSEDQTSSTSSVIVDELKKLLIALAARGERVASLLVEDVGNIWTVDQLVSCERALISATHSAQATPDAILSEFRRQAEVYSMKHRILLPLPRRARVCKLEANPLPADFAASVSLIRRLREAVNDYSVSLLGDWKTASEASELRSKACSVIGFDSVASGLVADVDRLVSLYHSILAGTGQVIFSSGHRCLYAYRVATHGSVLPATTWMTSLSTSWLNRLSQPFCVEVQPDSRTKQSSARETLKGLRSVLHQIEMQCFDHVAPNRNLEHYLECAAGVAITGVHSAAAAVRSGRLLSSSLEPEVWLRIATGVVSKPATSTRLSVQAPTPEPTLSESGHTPFPVWMDMLRAATRSQKKDRCLMLLRELKIQLPPSPASLVLFVERQIETNMMTQEVAGALGGRLLNLLAPIMQETSLLSMSTEALEDLYQEALDSYREDHEFEMAPNKLRSAVANRCSDLAKLHKFLSVESTIRHPKSPAVLSPRFAFRPPEARIITLDEYFQTRLAIARAGLPRCLTLQLLVLLTLMFRLGLRRQEALFIRPIDFQSDERLFVEEYDRRRAKTGNANRSIPWTIFVTAEEYEEAMSLVETVRDSIGAHASVFATAEGPDWFVRGMIADTLTQLLRSTIGDRQLRLHHLRHSFATWTYARLVYGCNQFCASALEHHHATLKWLESGVELRRKLYGSDAPVAKILQCIAYMMGHSSPITTMETYIHSSDWCDR